ncbi:penicillin acylase family protein [Streptomyces ficellus]|uniref:Penicillin acylase family protein n=1 Tax=Streptomyces ficellus TaxID=1977088 RepID=A0ABT7Z3M4_9ACTN|nr:penicillin acylase family protein [Streptomyces ficellus]MDN3294090.1 penicillin acylase family protein [Streptomyces ficellus]
MKYTNRHAQLFRWAALLVTCGLAAGTLPAAAAGTADTTVRAEAAGGPAATIRYTEYGVPHIKADDFTGLGYGYGYAVAKDNICVLADTYLTVAAQRSLHRGAEGPTNAYGPARSNLHSDLYFQQVNDSKVVEKALAEPAPVGPRAEVRDIVRGYVGGYNRYLAETGPNGVTDPSCKGAPWLRPIKEIDVYRQFHALSTSGGAGRVIDAIVSAAPPASAAPSTGTARRTPVLRDRAATVRSVTEALGGEGMGSNAFAVGTRYTENGRGLLLSNPHFAWTGAMRLWEVQLTVPGKLNASGGGLPGVPLIRSGHTQNVAWSHTVSAAVPLGLYQLKPVPGDPTSHLVDGRPERMTSRMVAVRVRAADGTLSTVERTLWSTRYGPVLGAAFGLPTGWTADAAYALRDGNTGNLRGLNTWFDLNRAQSTKDVQDALVRTQGIPWVNTVAADRGGRTLFSGVQVAPHLTDELAARCNTELGRAIFQDTGLSVLDGAQTGCAWGNSADAVVPGLLGPGKLPAHYRDDYASNSNDSAWLSNLQAPLTGYPRVVGSVGTERTPRTRMTLTALQERIAGTDGLTGKGFTRRNMQDLLFADRSKIAELAATDTARMCAALPGGKAPAAGGPVEVQPACRALAEWDRRFTPNSRGALLFSRFWTKLLGRGAAPWRTPFDRNDPVNTPRDLDTAHPAVAAALGDAVAELNRLGIAPDAPLGEHQYVVRGGRKLPTHGGPNALGLINVQGHKWEEGKGYGGVDYGASLIQVVSFTEGECPDVARLLASSQSGDPTSPHYADQTELYAKGQLTKGRFCESEIAASPQLRTVELRAP